MACASNTPRTVAEVTQGITAFRFNDAASAAYRFVWNLFCDWYVELSKPVLNGADPAAQAESRATAAWVLGDGEAGRDRRFREAWALLEAQGKRSGEGVQLSPGDGSNAAGTLRHSPSARALAVAWWCRRDAAPQETTDRIRAARAIDTMSPAGRALQAMREELDALYLLEWLAVVVAAMAVLVRHPVTGMVAAFVAVVAVVTAVAVTIVTIVSIVRAGATTISTSRLRTAFARFLGARFLGGLLGFLLLELIEYAVCSIGVLALLELPDRR